MHLTSVSESSGSAFSGQYLVQPLAVRATSVPGSTTIPDVIALPLLALLLVLVLRSSRNFGSTLYRNLRYAYLNYRTEHISRQVNTLERIFNRDSASY